MSLALPGVQAAEKDSVPTSYSPVVITERFDAIMQRMAGDKASVMQRHRELLEERYDLADKPADGAKMTHGKPIQSGVRVRLADGTSWPG